MEALSLYVSVLSLVVSAISLGIALGSLKTDWNYVRFHRRGFENVENELYLICTGFNLMKYHYKKLRKIMS